MPKLKRIFTHSLKQSLFLLTLLASGIIIVSLVLVVNHFVLSWTEPTANPPGGFTPQKPYALSAHDGDPADVVYVDDDGNVGIGTNDPKEKLEVNGQIVGGFGAQTTSGATDWNNITNTRSGSGHTLLRGNASHGPGSNAYFHPFNFEYNSKNGNGNITQFAIPYGNSTSINKGIYYRGRYSGSWTSWKKVGGTLSESNCAWYGTGKNDNEDNDQWHSVVCPAGYYARGWRGYVTDYVDYSIAIYCCKLSVD